jgi:hypothetical protein
MRVLLLFRIHYHDAETHAVKPLTVSCVEERNSSGHHRIIPSPIPSSSQVIATRQPGE